MTPLWCEQLSRIHSALNQHLEAKKLILKVLAATEELQGERTEASMTVSLSLATVHFELGNLNKARQLAHDVVAFRAALKGTDDLGTAEAMELVAKVHLAYAV